MSQAATNFRRGPILTEEQAVEIYQIKLTLNEEGNILAKNWRSRSSSAPVARHYQVSPKTIRDIWNRITWKYATSHLWPRDATISIPENYELNFYKATARPQNVEVSTVRLSFSFLFQEWMELMKCC
jgi:hypothetical protein